MNTASRLAWPLLAALATAPVFPGALRAQSVSLQGRVVDPAGDPVAGVTVVLHGVSEAAGGAELARTTSDDAGNFSLAAAGVDGAVYFAATRYEGALYVGTPFRDPARPPADYTIVIGANAAVGPGAGAARGSSPGPLPWWLALVVGVPAIGAVFLPLLPRGRAYAVRSLLFELADLEERLARDAAARDPERRRRYETERAALRARLQLTPDLGPSHAADQH